jgi:tRNA G18 (ribose-2'-O)-methylase SpoU
VPWVPIDDPHDPRIASFVGLRDRELARRVASGGPGVFIAEGDVVAERAVRAGYELLAVLVDASRHDPLPPGMDAGVPVYAAAPAVLQRITGLGVHRGLLACFARRPPPPAAEVLDAARRVVGMDAVLLDPTCSDPLYRRTARVAMGEGYGFPWAWIPRLPGGLDVLRAYGFRLIALTPDHGAVPLDDLALDGADDGGVDRRDERLALLFGAEGPGLSPGTLAAADVRAGIPMRGGVDSLNVGVAAGIAFWVLGRPATGRE